MIQQVRTSAESDVNKNILLEVKKVDGKFDILYTLSHTAAENPTGIIQEHIYPKVSQEKLRNLATELEHQGNKWYQNKVYNKMRSLYSHSHRRALLILLEIFTFKSNHQNGKLLLEAVEFIKQNKKVTDKYLTDIQNK